MTDYLDRFLDPLALSIVLGGTLLAAIVSATRSDLRRSIGALGPLLRARPEADASAAAQAVLRMRHLSEYKGIVSADRVGSPLEFVHRAACRLARAEGSAAFEAWAREEIEDRRARHLSAISVWRHAADVAPAMGMIGTVTGLVAMFARMSDPAAMGPAMAVAMLTTLYGLLLAFAVAGPVAARLERLSEAECRWQARTVERLLALARAEEEAFGPAMKLRRAG